MTTTTPVDAGTTSPAKAGRHLQQPSRLGDH
jgi:hypothetical protein